MVNRAIHLGTSWGGGGTPTPVLLTAPNNFGDASWRGFNAANQSNTSLDPLGTNTASIIKCFTTGGFAALRTTIPTTLSNGVNYSLTGYLAPLTAPNWLGVFVIGSESSGADFVSVYVNPSTGTIGTAVGGGGGVADVGNTFTVDANGFYKMVFNFHFSSGVAGDAIVDLRFADSDGGVPTNLQQFYMWGWGA